MKVRQILADEATVLVWRNDNEVKLLKGVDPDWYAVRGSVCAGGKRDGEIDPVRVKKWKAALAAV